MRSLALLFAFVIPVATASAASTITVDPHPLNKLATQAHRAQWVRMTFYNPGMKIHELRIGNDSFVLQARRTINLSVAAGSTILHSSPQDSRINERIAVTAADANRTIVVH